MEKWLFVILGELVLSTVAAFVGLYYRGLYLKLVRTRTKRGKTLQCVDCGAPIHRSDRYIILEVKHRDCRDPKGVGQLSLAVTVAEPDREAIAERESAE